LHKGYKKAVAVRHGNKSLEEIGVMFCPFETAIPLERGKKK
jgi:hypothetical protein